MAALGSNLSLLDRKLSITLTKPLELVREIAPEVQALHKRLEPRHPIENIDAYEKSYAKNENWGLGLDTSRTSQHQEIQLLETYFRRKGSRLEVKIDLPFPQPPPQKPRDNPIQQAMRAKDFLSRNLEQNFLSASKKLNIHRKRISKLMHIIDQLPPDFIEKFKDCADPKILHQLTVKKLFSISSTKDINKILKDLKNLSQQLTQKKT